MKLPKRSEPVQFTITIGVDDTVSIHNEDASMGIGFGPGTLVGAEIIEMLEDEGMI
jgi:hypothetical protein